MCSLLPDAMKRSIIYNSIPCTPLLIIKGFMSCLYVVKVRILFLQENIDYCSTVWDPPHRVHQVALERVQSFAARIVTRRWRQDAGPLKAHLKWPSLASRRKVQKLCVCRRILSGDSLIPSSTFIRASTVTRHHLNNQPLFRPFMRTNHHMSSFFVDAVLQWNKVPDSVCSLSSNLAFKSHIKKLFY